MSLAESLFENLIKDTEEKAIKLKYLCPESGLEKVVNNQSVPNKIIKNVKKSKGNNKEVVDLSTEFEADPLDPLSTPDYLNTDDISLDILQPKKKGKQAKANQKLFNNSLKIAAPKLSRCELENIVFSAKSTNKNANTKGQKLKNSKLDKVKTVPPLKIKLGKNKEIISDNDSSSSKSKKTSKQSRSSPNNSRLKTELKNLNSLSNESSLTNDSSIGKSPRLTPRQSRKEIEYHDDSISSISDFEIFRNSRTQNNDQSKVKNKVRQNHNTSQNSKNFKNVSNHLFKKSAHVNVKRLSINSISTLTHINKKVLENLKVQKNQKIKVSLTAHQSRTSFLSDPMASSSPKKKQLNNKQFKENVTPKPRAASHPKTNSKLFFKLNTIPSPVKKTVTSSEKRNSLGSNISKSSKNVKKPIEKLGRQQKHTNEKTKPKIKPLKKPREIVIDPAHFEKPYLMEKFGKQFLKCHVKIEKNKRLEGNRNINDWLAEEEKKIQIRKDKRKSIINKTVSFVETVEIFGESETEGSESEDEKITSEFQLNNEHINNLGVRKDKIIDSVKADGETNEKENNKDEEHVEINAINNAIEKDGKNILTESSENQSVTKENTTEENSNKDLIPQLVEDSEKLQNNIIGIELTNEASEVDTENSIVKLNNSIMTNINEVQSSDNLFENQENSKEAQKQHVRKIRKRKYYSPLKSDDDTPRNKSLRIADEKIVRPSISTLYGYTFSKYGKNLSNEEKENKRQMKILETQERRKELKEKKELERLRKLEIRRQNRKNKANKSECSDDEEYVVERIEDRRISNGITEYYIKWAGYPSEENTWEPEINVTDKDLIIEFEAKTKEGEQNTDLDISMKENNDKLFDELANEKPNDDTQQIDKLESLKSNNKEDQESKKEENFDKNENVESLEEMNDKENKNNEMSDTSKTTIYSSFENTENNTFEKDNEVVSFSGNEDKEIAELENDDYQEDMQADIEKSTNAKIYEDMEEDLLEKDKAIKNHEDMDEEISNQSKGIKYHEDMEEDEYKDLEDIAEDENKNKDDVEQIQEFMEVDEILNPSNEQIHDKLDDTHNKVDKRTREYEEMESEEEEDKEPNSEDTDDINKTENETESNIDNDKNVDEMEKSENNSEEDIDKKIISEDLESLSSDHSNDFEDTLDEIPGNLIASKAVEAAIAATTSAEDDSCTDDKIKKTADNSTKIKEDILIKKLEDNTTKKPEIILSKKTDDNLNNKTEHLIKKTEDNSNKKLPSLFSTIITPPTKPLLSTSSSTSSSSSSSSSSRNFKQSFPMENQHKDKYKNFKPQYHNQQKYQQQHQQHHQQQPKQQSKGIIGGFTSFLNSYKRK